jgi:ABC-type nitrate/sulfonate/bicarbonate transport system ATPase subunit/ABC-type nitrate/sulfonate/bicarbonate transport system permease component
MPDTAPAAQNLRLRLLGALGVFILLAGWAAASLAAGSFFVPAPWTTVADTVVLLLRAGTWTQILITFLRVCVGFLAGLTAGIAAGIAIGVRRETAALLKPLVLFFQGMPPLLWAIPLVALMGIGHLPTIVVITLITFPLVAVTIGEGMSTLPRDLGEMLVIFAPGFAARTRELVLPHLAPFLGAAVNTGLVLAVKASVTAEYFGANDGIGFQIQAAYMSLRIRSLFSWAAVLILLILLFNHLLPRIRRTLAAARTLARGRGPVTWSVEDVKELKRQFVSRGSAARTGPRAGSRRIALDGVSFSYRGQAEKSAALRGVDAVIANVDLTLKSGEIAVLTGESGIGKTTLLKLVASLLRPSSGKVIAPQRIGYVFQDDRLLPWRSVAENTALPLIYQGFPRKNALCFASWLLSEAGLSGEEEKRPDELSGGMKKRAALARCFARLPDAILMDEPFAGLHARARSLLWEMFLRLHSLHPVPALIVTHYPEELSSIASCRLYRLEGRPARLIAVR